MLLNVINRLTKKKQVEKGNFGGLKNKTQIKSKKKKVIFTEGNFWGRLNKKSLFLLYSYLLPEGEIQLVMYLSLQYNINVKGISYLCMDNSTFHHI